MPPVCVCPGEPVKVVPDVNFVDLREIMTSDGATTGVQ